MATFDELRLQQLLRPFENQSGIIGTNQAVPMINNIPFNTADILNQYNVPNLQNRDFVDFIIEQNKSKTVPISYPDVSDAPLRFATDDQASFFFPSDTYTLPLKKPIRESTIDLSGLPVNMGVANEPDVEQDKYLGSEPTGIAKLLQYVPFVGEKSLGVNLLKNLLPKRDPAASFMQNFYGSEYGLTPTGSIASGIMKGYNPVSGGFLNRITGGKFGDPTTIGLQNAYEKRINRIKKTLQDKYLSQGRSLDETELDERLAELERLKAEEFNKFQKFIKSRTPQPKGLGDIGSAGIDKTIQTGGAAENKFTESQKKSIRSRDLTGGPGKDYGPFSR